MRAPKDLETLNGLFGSVTDRTRPFLNRCSETKYLAVTNYTKATDQYLELARQALESPERYISSKTCRDQYLAVKSALEAGQLGPELIDALRSLRIAFLRNVLKPAMKEYMSSSGKSEQVERLYECALELDGLLEVVQFFGKVNKA
ncbi:MAG: hypothetical protein ACXABY_16235 [Candidatus Thorarchaeota archaeon]